LIVIKITLHLFITFNKFFVYIHKVSLKCLEYIKLEDDITSMTLADKEHALKEYAHINVLTELTREHTQLVHISERTHCLRILCLLG